MKVLSKLFVLICVFCLNSTLGGHAMENVCVLQNQKLNVYNVNLPLINDYKVIKKGSEVNLTLLNDVSTQSSKRGDLIYLKVQNNEGESLSARGFLATSSRGKRFAKHGSLTFSTNKLFLDNGQEINFLAESPEFVGVHPPHVSTNVSRLAQIISSFSTLSSPLTFGTSLGIGFLISGLSSTYQNGISDFFWGGLDGSGFSFIEKIFRKQPEIFLTYGAVLPFVLKEDLKISKGIQKEKIETLNLNENVVLDKIYKLLKWGDLTGALELSYKSGQIEMYNSLMEQFTIDN